MIKKLADTIEAGESMQSKQKRNKFKIEIFTAMI